MNSSLSLHPKVVGSGAGGGLAIVVMFVLNLCHVHVDPEGVAGITTVVALIGGYLAPLAKAEEGRLAVAPPGQIAPSTITSTGSLHITPAPGSVVPLPPGSEAPVIPKTPAKKPVTRKPATKATKKP